MGIATSGSNLHPLQCGRISTPATLTAGTLRIGTYFVNPPFEYVSKGDRVGFEVDLMNEVAHRLRMHPVFKNTQWESVLRQMQDGRSTASLEALRSHRIGSRPWLGLFPT